MAVEIGLLSCLWTTWALLDGLGTTAAQAVGGSVAQLSTFDDWGNQSFDTIGWNSAVNYTGETTDAGYGLNNYYSRSYDPTTGSWMSQDSWRGLLSQPQSLGRYAYVSNSPTSRQDLLGYCYADNSGAYLYGGPCAPKPTPVSSIPSLRVMEAYASEDNPGPHTTEWEPQVYSYDPSGNLQSVPARRVQGYDDGFPGYIPRDSTCTPGEAQGSWNAYCAPGADGGKSLAEMCANLWVSIVPVRRLPPGSAVKGLQGCERGDRYRLGRKCRDSPDGFSG